MSKFITTTYTNKKEILKFPDHYVAMAVTDDDSGITANADGKKIVPAGTIVGGALASVLEDASQKVQERNTQGANASSAEGVLFNYVDVTYGPAPGAMLVHGFIDINKLPKTPAAEAITALKGRIIFLK